MILIANIFCLPLLLVVWLIDGCLLLLLIRWILSRIPQARESQPYRQISLLTDPLPQWLGRQLQRVHHKNLPATVEWIVLIVLLVVIKHILIAVVIGLN